MNQKIISDHNLLELGKKVLQIEAEAIHGLVNQLDQTFVNAIRLMLECRGRIVVSGIGKSGHIARKIAATLASTGTPAFFVHSAEASHGDLGMITSEDIVIAISNSGESTELLSIVPLLKRYNTRLIAITGNPNSTLAIQADIHLHVQVEKEACPLGLAPTSSTTATLALGDALALTLLEARGFSTEDFARSHPGGKLGKRLLVRVCDVMHMGTEMPCVTLGCSLTDALIEMSSKGLGMTAIIDKKQCLCGLFTDGDLRRAFATGANLQTAIIDNLMVENPMTVHADMLAAEALQIMESRRINGLLVTDNKNHLIGMFNMHDLFRAGVV